MPALAFLIKLFVVALAAGTFGAMFGLGGGVILVPGLTLLAGVDIHYAIGASIVSVIATSSGAAAAYVRDGIANMRIGMFLEVGTTAGAVLGAYVAGILEGPWLFVLFGILMLYSALLMFRHRHDELPSPIEPGPVAHYLRMEGAYYDASLGRQVAYNVRGARWALPLCGGAGLVSGLLGVGGGILKVPTMDIMMKLPIKVSTSTSNFMIGVTAAASAGVYFMRGDINPFIGAPVAMGTLFGAVIGSRIMTVTRSTRIRFMFTIIMVFIAAQMLIKGLGIHL